MEVHNAALVVLREGSGLLDQDFGGRVAPTHQSAGGLVERLEVGRQRLPAHLSAQPRDVVLQQRVLRVAERGAADKRDRAEPGRGLREQSKRPDQRDGQKGAE